jgi:hypothetical protein
MKLKVATIVFAASGLVKLLMVEFWRRSFMPELLWLATSADPIGVVLANWSVYLSSGDRRLAPSASDEALFVSVLTVVFALEVVAVLGLSVFVWRRVSRRV